MLSYESISEALLESAEEAGLNIWQPDEALDAHTLQRTFTLICLPPGEMLPRPNGPQVRLRFHWDAAFTAISLLGTDALCRLYHPDDASCPHGEAGCAYEATLPLEIEYTIPVGVPIQDDPALLVRLLRKVQDIQRSLVDHSNGLTVDAEVQSVGSTLQVRHVRARQTWTITEPLHDLDVLEDVLDDACNEVSDVFETLLEQLNGTPRPPHTDMDMTLDPDEERIYLRPPVA